jgi:Xaa-Pro dipeptidase
LLLDQDRLKEFVERFDIDAFVATGRENVTYLSGFHGEYADLYKDVHRRAGGAYTGVQEYAIWLRGEPPVLILPAVELAALSIQRTRVGRVYSYGDYSFLRKPGILPASNKELDLLHMFGDSKRRKSTPTDALLDALKDLGLSGARLAVDFAGLAPETKRALTKRLPRAKVKEATQLFRFIRMSKSKEEIQRLEACARINERGLWACIEDLSVGMTELELDRVYRTVVTKHDAKPELFRCPGGKAGWGFYPPSRNKYRHGDLVWIDCGCIFKSYHSDTGSCAVLGRPTREQTRLYDACSSAIDAGLEVTRPGVHISEIVSSFDKAWSSKGYGSSGGFQYGHGIGLEIKDYPYLQRNLHGMIRDDFLNSSPDIELEENMVLNYETPLGIVGFGKVHNEQTIVVTSNGYRPLIKVKRELTVK